MMREMKKRKGREERRRGRSRSRNGIKKRMESEGSEGERGSKREVEEEEVKDQVEPVFVFSTRPCEKMMAISLFGGAQKDEEERRAEWKASHAGYLQLKARLA